MTLNEWSRMLKRQLRTHEARLNKTIDAAGALVQKTAKAEIGILQPTKGPFPAWEPLAPSTIAEKQRLGFSFNQESNPLLRTGQLRDSIQLVLTPNGFVVGSADPIAEYQELGTSRIPARPFIQPALFQSLPVIRKQLQNVVRVTLMGKPSRVAKHV